MKLYALAALALLASPAVAFACEPITSMPATITEGGQYCVANDMSIDLSSGAGIDIAAHNVTLDCGGHQLINTGGTANGSSAAIRSNMRHNVVIRNCRITGGWTNGIDMFQDNAKPNANFYNQIQDNYIAGPYWHGIRAYGSAIEITGNTIYDIGGQANNYAIGIRVGGSTSGFKFQVVRDNKVVGTNSPTSAAYGIFSDNSLSSVFADNGIVGTTAAAGKNAVGLYITGSQNRISDNHITGTGGATETGVVASNATNTCFNNYIRTTKWTSGCTATLGNY